MGIHNRTVCVCVSVGSPTDRANGAPAVIHLPRSFLLLLFIFRLFFLYTGGKENKVPLGQITHNPTAGFGNPIVTDRVNVLVPLPDDQ